MALQKYGLFYVSGLFALTGVLWFQRATPDIKGEDFAALYDVARQQAWSKLSDAEFISAGNHLKTTTVTRVDVSRELMSEISTLIRYDTILGGNGMAISLDTVSSAAIVDGFNLASISVAPWPQTNALNNRVDYNYAAVGPYFNGVPAAEHLWSLGSARSDGTRGFGYDDFYIQISSNRCPLLDDYVFGNNLVSFRTRATNSTQRIGGAVWPNNTQANFLWPFERKYDLLSAPLRLDQNINVEVLNITSNVFLAATNQSVNLTLMFATNRLDVLPQNDFYSITNRYLISSNTIQRYAQFNVGSRGASSWYSHYATLSAVSEVPVAYMFNSRTLVADQYAFNLTDGESATCTFAFRVHPGPGCIFRLTPLSSESTLITHGSGWDSPMSSNTFTHAVSFSSANSFGYTLSQLFRCEIIGSTNYFNPCIIAIGLPPSTPYPYAIFSSSPSSVIPDNSPTSIPFSLDFSKINSSRSNEFTHAYNPSVMSNNLNFFRSVMQTNVATLFICDPDSSTINKTSVLHLRYYQNGVDVDRASGESLDVDRYVGKIFLDNIPISEYFETNALAQLSCLAHIAQSHSYNFEGWLSSTNPVVVTNAHSFSYSSSQALYTHTASSIYPSLWSLTNNLVKRVRIFAVCDQVITEESNPFGVSSNFFGSVFSPSDKAVELANYYVNYCSFAIPSSVSATHFPVGHPIDSHRLTLLHDEFISSGRTNLISFTVPFPVVSSKIIAPPIERYDPRLSFGLTHPDVYYHSVYRSATIDVRIRRLAILVDWDYKFPTLP